MSEIQQVLRELTVVALPILLAIAVYEAAHGYQADRHSATQTLLGS